MLELYDRRLSFRSFILTFVISETLLIVNSMVWTGNLNNPFQWGSTALAQGTTPTLTVNGNSTPITVVGGASVTVVVWISNVGSATDWLGLYRVGTSDTAYLDYAYARSASLSFGMPSTPGVYEFRFFANNGYTKLATSPTV